MTMEVFLIILLLGFSITANFMFFMHIRDLTADFEGRIYELKEHVDNKEKYLSEHFSESEDRALRKTYNVANEVKGLYDAVNMRQTILEGDLVNLRTYTYSSMNELLKEKREGGEDGEMGV